MRQHTPPSQTTTSTTTPATAASSARRAEASDDHVSEPLSGPVREHFEARFGHDFGRIRVHRGPTADTSAHALAAHAYTFGSDIVLGGGRAPTTTGPTGRLLAHELVHTIQQGAARPLAGRVTRPFLGTPQQLARSPFADQTTTPTGVPVLEWDLFPRPRVQAPLMNTPPFSRPAPTWNPLPPIPTFQAPRVAPEPLPYQFTPTTPMDEATLASKLATSPGDLGATLSHFVTGGIDLPASCPPRLGPRPLLPCTRAPSADEREAMLNEDGLGKRALDLDKADAAKLDALLRDRRKVAARVLMEQFSAQLMKAEPTKEDSALDKQWIATLKIPWVMSWLAPRSSLGPIVAAALHARLAEQDLGALRRESFQAVSPLISSRLKGDNAKLMAWDKARGDEAKQAKTMPQATRLFAAILGDISLQNVLGGAISDWYLKESRIDERFERVKATAQLRSLLRPTSWYRMEADKFVRELALDPKALGSKKGRQFMADPRMRAVIDYLRGGKAKADENERDQYTKAIELLKKLGLLDHLKVAYPEISDEYPVGPPVPVTPGKAPPPDPVDIVLEAAERALYVELKDSNQAGNMGTSTHTSFTLDAAKPLFKGYDFGFDANWTGSRPGHSPALDVAPAQEKARIAVVAPDTWTLGGVTYTLVESLFDDGTDFSDSRKSILADQEVKTKLGMVACGTGNQGAIERCLKSDKPPDPKVYGELRGRALAGGKEVGGENVHSPEVKGMLDRLTPHKDAADFPERTWNELRRLPESIKVSVGGTFLALIHVYRNDDDTQRVWVQPTYTHPSHVDPITSGAPVPRGDEIGNVGSTGNAFGEHAHIYVHYRGPFPKGTSEAEVKKLPRYYANVLGFFARANRGPLPKKPAAP